MWEIERGEGWRAEEGKREGQEERKGRESEKNASWCNKGETYPVATSHILIVLSRDEEIKKSPDGMKLTEETL